MPEIIDLRRQDKILHYIRAEILRDRSLHKFSLCIAGRREHLHIRIYAAGSNLWQFPWQRFMMFIDACQ